ncbi:MAG: FKBP-type peptidyl-prolyl cis-trans isomerase [Bacteroidetes bacterium]|nr:FKBP-type peptidyl-prolyl cis-trans isomerase [Bacteroidota bacterium]
MKKIFPIFLIPVLLFGCVKGVEPCTNVTVDVEEPSMITFCTDHNIIYTKDPTGLFYQIINPGSGDAPVLTSSITVTYTSTFLDGTPLQTVSTPITGVLNQYITGWQIGLQKIKKGGEIKLVIPSSLAYGCGGYLGTVPPNSVLYFDIKLIDVQ